MGKPYSLLGRDFQIARKAPIEMCENLIWLDFAGWS